MRTTLSLTPQAWMKVKGLAHQEELTYGQAASRLIVGPVRPKRKRRLRNGIELAHNDGIPITMAEVQAVLAEP
jgi:hypothetical protein